MNCSWKRALTILSHWWSYQHQCALCNERNPMKLPLVLKYSLCEEKGWLMLIIWKKRDLILFLWLLEVYSKFFSYNQLASLLIELRKVWSRPTCQDPPLSNRVSSQGCFCTSAGGDMQASLRKRKRWEIMPKESPLYKSSIERALL